MSRHITRMTIDDAEHYSPAQRQAIIDSYPEHEREARTKGIPTLGSGVVFPIGDDRITCAPFAIPWDWPRINGLDFGWDHPFGATNLAWDRDHDVVYVTAEYFERQQTPIVHAAAIKPWGEWIPCAWPHDGLQHDKGSGDQLAVLYGKQGLNMLPDHATHEAGGNGVEAGITDMLDRMKTGRWKVFSTCGGWFAEKRGYHRKDGIIVKERDDVISSSRVGLMMMRFACAEPRKHAVAPRHGGGWMS